MFRVRCSTFNVPNKSARCAPARADFFYAHPRNQRNYSECTNCGFVWLNSEHHLSQDDEQSHYLKHENHPEDAHYRAFLNKLWQPLSQHLKPGSNGLDYGSGPGPTLHLMAQQDGYACAHYDPFFHPDKAVFGTQYDFITCTEVAEHFSRPFDEFQQFAALLKPGAWLGLMSSLLTKEIEFASWHYPRDPTHVSFYTPDSLKMLARQVGFAPPKIVSNSVVLLQRVS